MLLATLRAQGLSGFSDLPTRGLDNEVLAANTRLMVLPRLLRGGLSGALSPTFGLCTTLSLREAHTIALNVWARGSERSVSRLFSVKRRNSSTAALRVVWLAVSRLIVMPTSLEVVRVKAASV